MSSGSFANYGRPRRVAGGLRASSARGAIGRSWWSRRFLDVLESFALGTRLTRGRSYARTGQVLDLNVAPGRVSATVQGSQATPYRVRVDLAPFPEPAWARIEELLAGQALFSARLLAGDLPSELERTLAEMDVPLFPTDARELRMHCDCPDPVVPCKHLAATCYLLAELLDADPFQLLHWRGRDREQLLSRLRALRATTGTVERVERTGAAPAGPSADPVGATAALAGLTVAPLTELVDRFWDAPVALPARPATVETEPDLLLRQLGPADRRIGGPGLTDRLRRAYQWFGGTGTERRLR